MTPLQRLTDIQIDALLSWYQRSKRAFPWRENPDPYWVWLAEIMSQQTQMATLIPYFHRFIERFPDVAALARAGEEDVLAAWTGLGYYSRARNVQKAAKRIVTERGGSFPRTYEDWLELPGVGPYTAAAIASQCFGVREPVWDGNVIRVCSRLDARADALAAEFRDEMKAALREKLAGRNASDFNQALMELGATVCQPKGFICGRCPIQSACLAFERGSVESFPPPKPRKDVVDLRCKVLVRLRKGSGDKIEAYLQKRPESSWFPGMWDFPSELGGAARPRQDLTCPVDGHEFGEIRHQITHHRIILEGWVSREKRSKASGDGKWVSLEDLTSDQAPLPLSTTARKMLRLLFQKRLATL